MFAIGVVRKSPATLLAKLRNLTVGRRIVSEHQKAFGTGMLAYGATQTQDRPRTEHPARVDDPGG